MNFLKKILGWFPFTIPGFLVLGFCLFFRFLYATQHQDFILLVITTSFFVVLGYSFLSLFVSVFVFFKSIKKTVFGKIIGVTDMVIPTGFEIRRFFLFPNIDVSLSWVAPQSVECLGEWNKSKYQEKIIAKRRVDENLVKRKVVFRDILGLVSFSHVFENKQQVWIKPDVNKANVPSPLVLFSMGDEVSHPIGKPVGDYMEMRAYQRGDPVKHIVWKAYAKNRRLLVRVPEKAVSQSKKTVAYLVTGKNDEPAASLAWMTLSGGYLGKDFLFATDGDEKMVSNREEALKKVVESSNATHPGDNISRVFLKNPDAASSNCFLFVPAEMGPWLDELAGFKRFQNFHVFLSVNKYREPEKSNWKKWFFEQEAENFSEAREVHDRLEKMGFSVSIWEKN